MKNYNLINNALGWFVFLVAAVVYLITMEPTASFWDCGEFIASAYKLEVGHPPGNPIFMMTANLFTQLVSDPASKALMVNVMSAVFSALTIMFLFWTVTHLARKLIYTNKESAINISQLISIMGCGLVGALAYTFSDTFWFSAVEGEVYAFSSLMTALVFWLILKWEDVADEPHADRWLILIAYLMGLSIAVHLLNLLCIPAIVLVYYFRKYEKPTTKGALLALVVSFVIVGTILYGIIQGVVEVAGWFELLFVNTFKMPYNYGVAFYLIAVFGVLGWGIWETMREKYSPLRSRIAFILAIVLMGIPFIGDGIALGVILTVALTIALFYFRKINPAALNAILVGLLVILIGYSSYALIMIRSASNPPMDQNSPEDIFTLRTYLAREQYGAVPLFYGQTYATETKKVVDGNYLMPEIKDMGPVWSRIIKDDSSEKDRYYVSDRKTGVVYVDELKMLFPRLHSSDPRHIQVYKDWANIKGKQVRFHTPEGPKTVTAPTFAENLRFFFSYQVNFMYWRYFMWNFSGRQNDIQGHGEVSNGNWITGIKFIDQMLVGPQDGLPDFIENNKGHNKYYMLPLLLGLLGIFVQLNRGKTGTQDFWVTFLLFFMTGLAIVVYLNQSPYQPRERDYAYAGSFYAFCIWIGLGTAGVIQALRKYAKAPEKIAAIAGSLLCLCIPIQMAAENWDDHDRSKREVARDFGYNYLATCEPNAIIFTNGDNDTFPLWYAQEVEGYRTDVRVCNLSYLRTDWYIDQMKREAYESQPLPISWTKKDYVQGKNDVAYIMHRTTQPVEVSKALAWIKSDDKRTKLGETSTVPSSNLYIPVDKELVIQSGLVDPANYHWIVDSIAINLGEVLDENGQVVNEAKPYMTKEEFIILDMLNNNNDWSRPIYYATSVSPDLYLRLEDYFRQDGAAFRILPYRTTDSLNIDSDVLYDNLINKYRWGNLDKHQLYLDENARKMTRSFRLQFGALALTLLDEEKNDKVKEVVEHAIQVIPDHNVPYDYYSTGSLALASYEIGDIDLAKSLYDPMMERSLKNLNWYSRLNDNQYASAWQEVAREITYARRMIFFYQETDPKLFEEYSQELLSYMNRYESFMQARNRGVQGGTNR